MSKPLVSVIIPSMNRANRLLSCVQKLYQSVAIAQDLQVICVIDEDVESIRLLNRETDARILFNPVRQGAISCWNQGLVEAKADYIVFAGDDLEFQMGWLSESLIALVSLPNEDGMVGFNDNHRDGNALATHYLATRNFIQTTLGGRIAFPIFQFYCNDTVANVRAKNSGQFVWANKAFVLHHHYTAEGELRREKDALDYQNEQVLAADIKAFEGWTQRGCRIEWDSVL